MLSIQEFIQNNNYNINNLFVDKFWNSIKNDIPIYVDDNMLEYIGYDCNRERRNKEKYTDLLKRNFTENDNYKLINSMEFNNFLCPPHGGEEYIENKLIILDKTNINMHNKVKHLIVSPDVFKESLMLMQTEKSKQIRKYYIALEKVYKAYLQYQNDYQREQQLILQEQQKLLLEEKNKEIENLKEEHNSLKYKHISKEKKVNNENLYIASSKNYIKKDIYKIGKSINLENRIKSYSTARIDDDKIELIRSIKCSNSDELEKYIFAFLKNYKYSSEMFQINIDILNLIFDNIEKFNNNLVESFNTIINTNLLPIKKERNLPDITNKLTNESINNFLKNHNLKLLDNYENEEKKYNFRCLSIFKHKFECTYGHIRAEIGRGCYYCTKYGCLDKVKIYRYNKSDLILDKIYNEFDDVKKEVENFKLLKNIIRENRWLTAHNGFIYSILSPENNKLNINKELNDIEKQILIILGITNYKKDRKLIYAKNIESGKEYSNESITSLCNDINETNLYKKLNRKTVSKKIISKEEYNGFLFYV